MDLILELRRQMAMPGKFNIKHAQQIMMAIHGNNDVNAAELASVSREVLLFFSKAWKRKNIAECTYIGDIIERAFVMIIWININGTSETFRITWDRWVLSRIAKIKNNEGWMRMAIDIETENLSCTELLNELVKSDDTVCALKHMGRLFFTSCIKSSSERQHLRNEAIESFQWLNANVNKWKLYPIFPEISNFPMLTVLPSFYLTYHDANICDIMNEHFTLYQNLLNNWYVKTPIELKGTNMLRTAKRRIGFLSKSLGSHSVGRIAYGLIEKLAQCGDFDVYVYSNNIRGTVIGDRIFKSVKKFSVIDYDIATNINMIRKNQLDIFILLDPLQDMFTYLLSQFRCAPVQISTWGHPGTTGLKTIDYYITSKYFDIHENMQSYHTEKLVLFNSLSIYYNHINHLVIPFSKPDFNLTTYFDEKGGMFFARNMFKIPINRTIYGLVGPMFKVSPEFDDIIVNILTRDPNSIIVMQKGDYDETFTFTMNRLNDKLGNKEEKMKRIMVMDKRLELLEFSFYINACQVILDTFPFGGLISTYDVLSSGKCMIALPGKRIGTFTAGLYKRMGVPALMEHLVASDIEDYVMKAIRIANNADLRMDLETMIAENVDKLHHDQASFEEWRDFLKSVKKDSNCAYQTKNETKIEISDNLQELIIKTTDHIPGLIAPISLPIATSRPTTVSRETMGAGASVCANRSATVSASYDVFLNGSCNPTTWRKDIAIPMLEHNRVTYYNPQVENWDPSMIEKEKVAKLNSKVHLFVIDSETRAYASIAEAAYLIGKGSKVVMVIKELNKEVNGIQEAEFRDANRGRTYLKTISEDENIPVFQEVQDAVAHICKIMKP